MATNPATHTEVPSGGHKEPFPPFQSETFASQLLWLALTFVVLYLLMSRIALPRIGSILEARRQHVAGDLAEAERLKGESDAALAAYEKALADARSRAQALANQTREQQAAEAEATRKELDAKLALRLGEAEKSIATTRAAAMANVQAIATDAAAAIVERLTGATPTGRDVADAVAAVVKR